MVLRIIRCRKCGATFPDIVDGSLCGGIPGIRYRYCNGCGHASAITRRTRKERLCDKPQPKPGN
jgi:Pyruvate/2-oxoacid:ferredoxin oxidoreductase delta subunit